MNTAMHSTIDRGMADAAAPRCGPAGGVDVGAFAQLLKGSPAAGRDRITLDPDNVQKGLGQLVLTILELLRQLLERQALRRIEGGSLTDEEVERLGLTFMRLAEQMDLLKTQFGLTDDDLNLDLGPIGKLL